MRGSRMERVPTLLVALAAMIVLSGCSLLFGGGTAPEPTREPERQLVPTFTPTPEQAAVAPVQEAPAAEPPPTVVVEAPPPTPAPQVEPEATPTEEPPTPAPSPKVTVNIATANTRNGPGTNYGLAGAVSQGQSFDVIARSPDGTWWQVCCVNGQEVWIFGDLVVAENTANVPVAQNIPAPPPPVAVAPTPEPPPPPAPSEPEPAPPPAPAGAVHAGPCGGDDGCKFRIRNGPAKRNNGGGELKMQLFFIHSGVDGGQPQGDYRLAVEKDGQLINVFADTTSIVFAKNQGPMGLFNYEAKIGASSLPGGTVEGRYYIWVLDGNRERDSEVFTLDLGGGEGEVWIEFDQG